MYCFQRRTRIDGFGSGAAPFQVGSADAVRLRSSPAPATTAPDVINFRLVIWPMFSSLSRVEAVARRPTIEIGTALRLSNLRRHPCATPSLRHSVLSVGGISQERRSHYSKC